MLILNVSQHAYTLVKEFPYTIYLCLIFVYDCIGICETASPMKLSEESHLADKCSKLAFNI